jgi:DnaJ-class molecular chaperone
MTLPNSWAARDCATGNAANRNARERHMKKPIANPTEQKCPVCSGTGFARAVQPAQPNRRIYPAPCKECGGKGRIKEAAN